MKRKILVFCICLLTLSMLISCFSWYTYKDTTIESIVASNLLYQTSYYQSTNDDNMPYEQYGLSCNCIIKDSITREAKQYAFLETISVIQNAYGAYDPGWVEEYALKDSLLAIQVFSLYNFNDNSSAGTDLLDYFNIGYIGYYDWNFKDSITDVFQVNNIEHINEVLSMTDRDFDNISLILTLKEKPHYEQQQFVVNLVFQSGRSLTDTAKLVNLE